jgi:protein gp37
MHPDWARSLRDQCQAAKVPFFFKQWGEWREVDGPKTLIGIRNTHAGSHWLTRDGKLTPRQEGKFSIYHEYLVARLGKSRAGRLLDGREWNDLPHQLTEAAHA